MINERSLLALKAASWRDDHIRPLYHSYCYSKIPGTVRRLLGQKAEALPADCFEEGPYDAVVVFLIDGFGWRFFEKYAKKYPFLQRFCDEGIVSKITSQFPSTTAPHVTCIHTGLEVGQSGIYEWFHYEPIVDRVIAPLLYSYAGDKEIGTIKASPKEIFPFTTIYQELEKSRVPSFVLQCKTIAGSPYSQAMLKGALTLPYETFEKGLRQLAEKIEEGGYFFIYFGDVDAQGHRHGVDSQEVDAAVDRCFGALESEFWEKIDRQDQEIATIVTADHGMIDVNPKKTFYVNEKIPELLPLVRKNRQGRLLAPAGSCRDFFLHIAEGKIAQAHELLQERLGDLATVHTAEELVEEGFFGGKRPSERFFERVGDLVILPHGQSSVWWHESHRFDMKFHAMHGGLSRAEMETIFLFMGS